MELLAIAVPFLIFVFIFRAVAFKKQIEAKKWEDKTGQVLLYRILWGDKVYHRAYCVDVAKDGHANTVLIESPEKAISEGVFPCQKCKPPTSSKQLQDEMKK